MFGDFMMRISLDFKRDKDFVKDFQESKDGLFSNI